MALMSTLFVMAAAMFIAAAILAFRHVLAAIHPAIVVAVGAATVAMTLVLAGLMLAMFGRGLAMLPVIGRTMVLVLSGGHRLRGGGISEGERKRADDEFHDESPEIWN